MSLAYGITFTLIISSFSGVEHLENELASELENARLFRLLCKFGFINERPEYALFIARSPFYGSDHLLKIRPRSPVERDW